MLGLESERSGEVWSASRSRPTARYGWRGVPRSAGIRSRLDANRRKRGCLRRRRQRRSGPCLRRADGRPAVAEPVRKRNRHVRGSDRRRRPVDLRLLERYGREQRRHDQCIRTGPPDTTPPTVAVTAPAGGTTVSGTVTVTAAANDNLAVAGVQFKLDGNPLGAEDTSRRTPSPGTPRLRARAATRSARSDATRRATPPARPT